MARVFVDPKDLTTCRTRDAVAGEFGMNPRQLGRGIRAEFGVDLS
jgi:hypothetical protein